MNNISTKNKIAFADLMIVIMIIFISPETLLFGTNAVSIFLEISKYFPVILFIILFAMMQKGKKCSNHQFSRLMLFWVIFSFCMLLSAVYNNNLMIGYGLRIVIMGAGFLFAVVYSLDKFMYVFERIIYTIALASIVIYVIGVLLPSAYSVFPTVYNIQAFPFYNAFISVIPKWSDGNVLRLYGPFREPGVYQMYLNMALLFFIDLNGKLTLKRAIVYIVAIILTFSTTGYIVLLFTFLYYVFKNESKKSRIQKNFIILLILLSITILSLYTTLFSADSFVFGKLFNDESKSGTARFASILGNLSIFASSPIFGVGITRLPELFVNYIEINYGFFDVKSNTSTIFVPFATFGILYGTLWVISLTSFFKSFSTKALPMISICLAGLLSFMGENLVEDVLVYILVGYGIIYFSSSRAKIHNTEDID